MAGIGMTNVWMYLLVGSLMKRSDVAELAHPLKLVMFAKSLYGT